MIKRNGAYEGVQMGNLENINMTHSVCMLLQHGPGPITGKEERGFSVCLKIIEFWLKSFVISDEGLNT